MFKEFTPPQGYKLLKIAPNYIIGELIYNFLKTEGFHPQLISSTFPYTDPIYMGRGLPVYIIIPEDEFEEVQKILEHKNFEE